MPKKGYASHRESLIVSRESINPELEALDTQNPDQVPLRQGFGGLINALITQLASFELLITCSVLLILVSL